MRISDWSSDVCSSDLPRRRRIWLSQGHLLKLGGSAGGAESILTPCDIGRKYCCAKSEAAPHDAGRSAGRSLRAGSFRGRRMDFDACSSLTAAFFEPVRSEGHPPALKSRMRISDAAF